jgi:hypothetical protein
VRCERQQPNEGPMKIMRLNASDALGRPIEKKDLVTSANTRRYYHGGKWRECQVKSYPLQIRRGRALKGCL